MDKETENQNVNQEEGLLANTPQTEEVEPKEEETTIPHKEEEKPQEPTPEKEEEKLAKPEYLEDKFWDEKSGVKVEELNHSYKELQKQFSMGKHKAPKEYDVTSLEDVEDDDELKTYFLDWAKENKPTQAAFDNLVNKFKELSLQQEEADSIDIDAETKSLGPNAPQIIKGIKDKWNEEQKKEFTIKDNVAFGEWDWDVLANEWDVKQLEGWAVNVPNIKNTELLSGLEYKPMYYEPKENPHINLEDCVDLEKYNNKLKALDEYKLTKEQKEILKLFVYRFIKIDFENVANYYFFNATEEEQKAIERLRLVLTDDGLNGFIEDDLIRILNLTDTITDD